MRNISIFKVIVFGCIAMAARCQDDPVIKVEFTSLTRGYQKQIFISRDSVVETINGLEAGNKSITRKLAGGEWKSLAEAIGDISLEEIPDLPSPTSRRAFDGARHSTIVISTRAGKSYTHAFDDEDPHEKLQPLMTTISKIVEKERK